MSGEPEIALRRVEAAHRKGEAIPVIRFNLDWFPEVPLYPPVVEAQADVPVVNVTHVEEIAGAGDAAGNQRFRPTGQSGGKANLEGKRPNWVA